MPPTYASRTRVAPSKTLDEIRRTLRRFGAEQMAYAEDERKAEIRFHYEHVPYAVQMPLTGNAQEVAARWRALLLYIKGALALVEAGGSTFSGLFFGQIVLPSGLTVAQSPEVNVVSLLTGLDVKKYDHPELPDTGTVRALPGGGNGR